MKTCFCFCFFLGGNKLGSSCYIPGSYFFFLIIIIFPLRKKNKHFIYLLMTHVKMQIDPVSKCIPIFMIVL